MVALSTPKHQTTTDILAGLIDPDAAAYETESQLAKLGEEVERNIVAQALRNETVLQVARKLLPSKVMGHHAHRLILNAVYAHWDVTGRIIPAPILKEKIKKEVEERKDRAFIMGELKEVCDWTPVNDYDAPSYVAQIVSYAKRAAVVKAFQTYIEDKDMRALFAAVDEARTFDGTEATDYELFSDTDLQTLPDIVWQIEGHFPKNSTVNVYGSSGVGKSFLCLDMARSIAHGVPYLNKWETVKGNVLYICSEGSYGLKGRVHAWLSSRGLKPVPTITYSTTCHDLQDRGEVERLIRKAKDKLPGGKIDIVFVDTLSRNFGAGDTDKNQDMQAYLKNVDYIRQATGATVVNVHHTGHGDPKRERGAKSLRDYCDTSICVSKEGDGIEVSCQKQKDAAEFVPYILAKTATGTSLVLKLEGTRAELREAEEDKNEAAKMGELLNLIPDHALDEVPTEANTVTLMFLVETLHIRKKTVTDALARWVTDAVVCRGKLQNSSREPFRYWRHSVLS